MSSHEHVYYIHAFSPMWLDLCVAYWLVVLGYVPGIIPASPYKSLHSALCAIYTKYLLDEQIYVRECFQSKE